MWNSWQIVIVDLSLSCIDDLNRSTCRTPWDNHLYKKLGWLGIGSHMIGSFYQDRKYNFQNRLFFKDKRDAIMLLRISNQLDLFSVNGLFSMIYKINDLNHWGESSIGPYPTNFTLNFKVCSSYSYFFLFLFCLLVMLWWMCGN